LDDEVEKKVQSQKKCPEHDTNWNKDACWQMQQSARNGLAAAMGMMINEEPFKTKQKWLKNKQQTKVWSLYLSDNPADAGDTTVTGWEHSLEESCAQVDVAGSAALAGIVNNTLVGGSLVSDGDCLSAQWIVVWVGSVGHNWDGEGNNCVVGACLSSTARSLANCDIVPGSVSSS
jgi:hypothetical protein